MCFLNCILISIVTLTQSLTIPETAQLNKISLDRVKEEHPKFLGTFLGHQEVFFFFVVVQKIKKNVFIISRYLAKPCRCSVH